MEIINPSKYSTCGITFFLKIFHKSSKFSIQYQSNLQNSPWQGFCCLQTVANEGETLHSRLTVICSTFSSHKVYFPVRISGHFHRKWITKWKTRYWKGVASRSKQGEWFLFSAYATLLPLPVVSSRAHTGLPPHLSFIFHSVVLSWSQLSAVTKDHLLLLHRITHKTVQTKGILIAS